MSIIVLYLKQQPPPQQQQGRDIKRNRNEGSSPLLAILAIRHKESHMRRRWIRLPRRRNDFWCRRSLHEKTAPSRSSDKFLKEPKWSVSELTNGELHPDDSLRPEDVRRIGQLSQLDILDKDIPAMLVNMNKILNFAKGVESGKPSDSLENFTTLYAATHNTPLREDIPCDTLSTSTDSISTTTQTILSNASETHWGYFVVEKYKADDVDRNK